MTKRNGQLSNIFTVAGREFKGLIDSPIAYVVALLFVSLAGWLFFSQYFLASRVDMRFFFGGAEFIFTPSALLVVLIPALTMGALAQEELTGTIELVRTLPITETELVIGKFLGIFGLAASMVLACVPFALLVGLTGPLDIGPVLGGFVGMLLLVAAMVAIGVLFSSIADSQVTALLASLVVGLTLYFMALPYFVFLMPAGIDHLIQDISLSQHLSNFARGVIDTRDTLYFISMILGSLFVAVQVLRFRTGEQS